MSIRPLHKPLRCLLVLALVLVVVPSRHALAQEQIHIVQPGETLFRIGLHYGITWQTLMAVNGLTSITIYPGQQLISPAGAVDTGTAPAPGLSRGRDRVSALC